MVGLRERLAWSSSSETLLVLGALLVTSPVTALAQFVDATLPPLDVNTGDGNVIGVSWADFDQDGDLDLYSADFTVTGASRLFRRDGPNAFSDVTSATTQGGQVSSGGFGDYDDDGDMDLYLNSPSDGGDNRLLRNDGGTTFADVTVPPLGSSTGGRTTTWLDFDLDGDLDLSAPGIHSSRLFRNDGGTFTNIASDFSVADPGQCMTWADFDRDGDPDAYRTNGGPGTLARNDGSGVFTSVGTGVNVLSLQSDWGDFDNDGDLDIFTGSDNQANALLRNDGNQSFANVVNGDLFGLNATYTSTWGDYDNDGDLDLFYTQLDLPCVLFRNDTNTAFANVSTLLTTSPVNARSASWADYDGDGDLDLYVGQSAAQTGVLLRNDIAATNHWLHVKLVGTVSNRGASGARVTLVAGGVTRVREMFEGGQGWCSQGSSVVEFGLGAATTVTSLNVRWPSGVARDVAVSGIDRVITVTEPDLAPKGALANGFTPGSAINFVLDTHGANVTDATLFFRPAGSGGAFTQAGMIVDDVNDELEAAVPVGAASENGIEYHVQYSLNFGTRRAFPDGGAAAPAFLPANLGTRTQPAAAPANEYVLFSVPFAATNASLAGVLEDDLGAYDNTKWRFGRFVPSSGTYLEAANVGSLIPGRGFWLIERNPVVLDAEGVSNNTIGGTSIPLDPGWNQIGHPYLFPVPTSAVDFGSSPNVVNRFVGREGGAYVDQTTLEPWKGYWVFNGGTGTQAIVVPSDVGGAPAPRAKPLAPLDWGVEVIARAGSSSDVGNIAGAASSGEAAALSLPEPPRLPGTVRVYFAREDARPHEWTTDVREVGEDSESYDLIVETPDAPTALTFARLETLPKGWRAVLLNDEHLAAIDLAAATSLPISPNRTFRFRLVVGTESALAQARGGMDPLPTSIMLAAPRPNPFSGATTIAFALPAASNVDLSIYDVGGRLVRRLAGGVLAAGVHRIEWNASDDHGARASSGVYFAKLRAGSEERIEKVVLLK